MAQKRPEYRVLFEKSMKDTHTILIPAMLPIHFAMIRDVLNERGYKAVLLDSDSPRIAQLGLKYVHNDTCYPALLVIGQMLEALESGRYDIDRTALMITQTGGGCRASNYIHLLRKALERAGMGHVPVISLNMSGMEPNPGFRLSLPLLRKMIAAFFYGDVLMLLSNQARPYEVCAGDTDRVLADWIEKIGALFRSGLGCKISQIRDTFADIARSFDAIPHEPRSKIKVGIVGEIYMKYARLGNNAIESFLRAQDCEYMIPGVMGFGMFSLDNRLEDHRLYGGNRAKYALVRAMSAYLERIEDALIAAVKKTRFLAPEKFRRTRELVKGVIGHGSKMGEGWLLTAEMLELIEYGYPNIICTQPFGCLPNHINGRGMINRVRALKPEANIVAIDYDPSASRVNQENRIKLMLASARSTRRGALIAEADQRVSVAHGVPSYVSYDG